MSLIRCLQITNEKEATQVMENLGVNSTGIDRMQGNTLHLNLKVEDIAPRAANLLKQEMLALGGDAAVDGRGLDCGVESTGALVMGTQKQIEELSLKLTQYPKLEPLSRSLRETLTHLSQEEFSLRFRSRTLALGRRTLLMGILNVTPDSFSDGGLYFEKEKAIAHGRRMVEEGADLIDIGGESTRPGSQSIPVEEELRRVLPVVEGLAKQGGVPLSVDTRRSAVARGAIDAGAEMINDVSGLHADPALARIVAEEKIPIILMHMRGTPDTMQKDIHYESFFSELLLSLKESIETAESAGIDPNQIVIDPGIGFGKTLEHNLLLMKHLPEFRVLGKPILLGTSRKSFIGKILNEEVDQRFEGTLSTIAIGVLKGAHIIRCHDVLPAKRVMAVADAIRLAGNA